MSRFVAGAGEWMSLFANNWFIPSAGWDMSSRKLVSNPQANDDQFRAAIKRVLRVILRERPDEL
jgi:hypothetical protein